ncbi:MAG: hypothetical protein LBE09_00630 [Christensenellaceae bacterium]|jgi:hypothetical protein|nr:hypothetical protein [Christensenellaceae bacterium]
MEIFFKKTIANLSFLMMRIIDAVSGVFNALVGIQDSVTVDTNGQATESVYILDHFLQSSTITNAWFYMLLIAVALLALFTMLAAIKSMISPKKGQGKVLTSFFGALAAFFVAQFVVFGGIALSNEILQDVNMATKSGQSLTISQRIIELAVDDDGWRDGNTSANFNPTMTATVFFGSYKKSVGFETSPKDYEENIEGVWVPSKDTYIKTSNGYADLYKTNLLLLFAVPLIILVMFCVALFKMSKRIFEVVFLYLVMPFTISTIPLDDGSRFKLWRESIIGKTLSVYGTLVAFNLFFLFFDQLPSINLVNGTSFVNTLFDAVLIIGAALAACAGSELFVSLLGGRGEPQGSGFKAAALAGMGFAHGVGRGVGKALFGKKGGGKGGAGGAAGVAEAGSRGGILGTAAKAGNFLGTSMLGGKFTNTKAKGSASYQNLKNILTGKQMTEGYEPNKLLRGAQKFMNAGGVGGVTAKAGKKVATGVADVGSAAIGLAQWANQVRKNNKKPKLPKGGKK